MVMLAWMFFTSDQDSGVQMLVLVVYDLSTGATHGDTLMLCYMLMLSRQRNRW